MKLHRVIFDATQREQLLQLVASKQLNDGEKKRVRVLLYADEGPLGMGLTDTEIAIKIDVHRVTVLGVRHRYARLGLEGVIGVARTQRSQAQLPFGNPESSQYLNNDWLTVRQAAQHFRCSDRTIRLLANKGILKRVHYWANKIHVSRQELAVFIQLGDDPRPQ